MTLPEAHRHSVIAQHLRMAQRCNAMAAELHGSGDASAAARQRRLLAVLLHNALMQLPTAQAAAQTVCETWHEPAAGR